MDRNWAKGAKRSLGTCSCPLSCTAFADEEGPWLDPHMLTCAS
jgi:hypothetical protein